MVWVVGFAVDLFFGGEASFLRNHQRKMGCQVLGNEYQKIWINRFGVVLVDLCLRLHNPLISTGVSCVFFVVDHWVFCWTKNHPIGLWLDPKAKDWYFVGWSFFSPDIFRFRRLGYSCWGDLTAHGRILCRRGEMLQEIGDFFQRDVTFLDLLTSHLFQEGLEDDVPLIQVEVYVSECSIPYVVAEW